MGNRIANPKGEKGKKHVEEGNKVKREYKERKRRMINSD